MMVIETFRNSYNSYNSYVNGFIVILLGQTRLNVNIQGLKN